MPSRIARLVMGITGLRVSKPSKDAFTAQDADLLFSTTRQQVLMLGYGTFQLYGIGDSRNNITYAIAQPDPPVILCGLLTQSSFINGGTSWYLGPVSAEHIQSGGLYTGFRAEPLPDLAGVYRAIGQTCQWLAFPKLPASA